MSDEPHSTAGVSLHSSQELRALRQAFLESLNHFIQDVRRFSHEWQTRWNDAVMTQSLAEISEALLITLAGLETEFSQSEGPSRHQVARLLNTLLGTHDAIGLLTRLQALAASHAAPTSLDDQRLLSEVDTLFIQLTGLRAQWRDYLALITNSGREEAHHSETPLPSLPDPYMRPATNAMPPLPRAWPARPEDEVDGLPPLPLPGRPPRWGQNGNLAGGLGDLLRTALPILLVVVVLIVLIGGIVSQLPKVLGHSAPTAPTAPTAPLTAAAQPTLTTTPRPPGTPAPPVPTPARPPQLSVNPSVLLLPCPGTGAATLQLANTGVTPLDWQASILSTSGSAPGILLDGENTEGGHLDPGAVTQISVTAQARGAQGSLSISYGDDAAPITVPYSLNC